jgi:hypothetical protein
MLKFLQPTRALNQPEEAMQTQTCVPPRNLSMRRASGFAIFAGGMLVLAVQAMVRLHGV